MSNKLKVAKTLKVGIMPSDKFQQRVLDIAAGRYKPAPSEPKIWFSSLKSLAEVLNENILRFSSGEKIHS